VELAIRTAVTRLGGGMLERLLAADPGYRGPRVPCGAGHQAGFVSYRDKTVDTVLGPVALHRAWYHCGACGHSFAPGDAELDVAGETMSPGLAKMTARAAAAVPFTPGAALVGELAGIELTGRRLGRHAEADGTAAAAVIREQAAAIAARALVPFPPAGHALHRYRRHRRARDDGRDPGPGRQERRRQGPHREVKLCCAFTQASTDQDGRPVRDPGSSSYLASFAPAAGFGVLMAAEARRRGAGHVRQLVVLGDGAVWIWNLASQHFPEATQIVDLFHAREHLHELARLLEFLLGGQHGSWLAARLGELDNGDIPALLSAARQFPLTGIKAQALDTALGYFETNAPRMRYQHFRSLGMFVGSGAVEAGCKAVIGQRLKLSGMHWSVPGAAGILTLRCQQASNRWEEIWHHPPSQPGAA
jgi:hypothetical protein